MTESDPTSDKAVRDALHKRLTQKFPDAEVGQVPGKSGGGKYDYIEARSAMDRLDEAVGPFSWSTSYRIVDAAAAAVECTLTIFGVSRSDVGYPNNAIGATNKRGERIDSDKPLKEAYSDALKRVAVQWGIARYLYATAGKTARYAEEADGNGATIREERAPTKSDGNRKGTRSEVANEVKQSGGNGSQGAAPVALLRVKVAELAGLVGLDNPEIVNQVKAQTGVDLRAQNDPPARMKALDWLEGQIAMQTLARESQRA